MTTNCDRIGGKCRGRGRTVGTNRNRTHAIGVGSRTECGRVVRIRHGICAIGRGVRAGRLRGVGANSDRIQSARNNLTTNGDRILTRRVGAGPDRQGITRSRRRRVGLGASANGDRRACADCGGVRSTANGDVVSRRGNRIEADGYAALTGSVGLQTRSRSPFAGRRGKTHCGATIACDIGKCPKVRDAEKVVASGITTRDHREVSASIVGRHEGVVGNTIRPRSQCRTR